MTAFAGLGRESRKTLSPEPLPADPTGQRLCEIFGRYPWKFIQAALPDDATAKATWQTVTKYPLRPRVLWNQWQDANTLIGVRFTHDTYYGLLDIDAGSDYCTPDGIAQIRAALETIGITRTLLIRSSWNGGLHLYLPFAEPVNTFSLAVALKECLKSQGFRLKQGQLEIFPNVKAFGVETFIEYQGHRLPLQPASGSCLLDDDLNSIGDSLARFFWLWDQVADHQDMDTLLHAFKIGRDNHRKRPKRKSHPVESWRQDLDIEITEGWTAHGQTNHLLKTIACYGRVFEGLQGQDLIDYTLRMAISRPGYEQWCRHQHDIERKVTAWARAVENYYWPLGTTPTRDTHPVQNNLVSFNRQQSEDAQSRIKAAYTELEQTGELPEQITARATAIARLAKVSQQTLYKYPGLWHPLHVQGEINGATGVSAAEIQENQPQSEPLKVLENKALHPLEQIMKGWGLCPGDFGSDPESFSPNRGVRGDELSFPQAESADVGPELPIPLAELEQRLRATVQKLGWNAQQLTDFIAQRFGGRRRSQLYDYELVMLLYYLQVATIKVSVI
jgi:hypothetical protein